MNNGINNNNLQKIIQINNSLDNINIFNNINLNNLHFFSNNKMNDKQRINSQLYFNNSTEVGYNNSNFNGNYTNNNNKYLNSSLNEIIRINKGIDGIYDSIQLMKSNNKINSKILYQISHSSQTLEGY